MRRASVVLFPLILAFAVPSFASEGPAPAVASSVDEVVVTATRIPTPAREVASSVTVITRRDIERRGAATVEELLRDVPGVEVVAHGGPGSVFVRGARSAD